jgi:adenosylhomocysteine nucleosidase
MKRIGIIAALPAELKPLVQGWKKMSAEKGMEAWQGDIDGSPCIAACAGMGKQAAERACVLAAEGGSRDVLISVGWAGAISCGMQPGQAYVMNEVIDGATEERFATHSPAREGYAGPLRIVTLDHVALAAEKRQLGERYQAVLVDMEAAAVAAFAQRQGSEFYCLKAVSDTASEKLPDFSRYTDSRGHLQLAAFVADMAIRPQFWPSLARVAKNGKGGAAALASTLVPIVRDLHAKGKSEVYK